MNIILTFQKPTVVGFKIYFPQKHVCLYLPVVVRSNFSLRKFPQNILF